MELEAVVNRFPQEHSLPHPPSWCPDVGVAGLLCADQPKFHVSGLRHQQGTVGWGVGDSASERDSQMLTAIHHQITIAARVHEELMVAGVAKLAVHCGDLVVLRLEFLFQRANGAAGVAATLHAGLLIIGSWSPPLLPQLPQAYQPIQACAACSHGLLYKLAGRGASRKRRLPHPPCTFPLRCRQGSLSSYSIFLIVFPSCATDCEGDHTETRQQLGVVDDSRAMRVQHTVESAVDLGLAFMDRLLGARLQVSACELRSPP